ncbi:hypothetical protein C2G38_2230524 [Gigaspora rosea]|uniref:Uncharacterized protein n=1 Tax=Gigaspora rosea TaxID=44941 RepID=A0A397TVU9_9GLOM|nr:hypothetical protein C2G38_2230524 [Gigaspora rosea]
MLSEALEYITVSKGIKSFTTNPLYYIDNIRAGNVYLSPIRNKVDKRIEFGNTMSVARTSIQVAMAENVTAKLTGLLIQFLMKYRRSTGLNIEEVHYSMLQSNEIPESFSIVADSERQVLSNNTSCNLPEISNLEYHKPRGCPPKRLKSAIEKDNNKHKLSFSKTYRYCQEKGHNIRGCAKQKTDSVDKVNCK